MEFKNPTVSPGDEEGGEEYIPTDGWFSPDGTKLAFTVVGRSCFSIVCEAGGGRRKAFLRERRVLGWADRTRVFLGSRRTGGKGDKFVSRLYLYDMEGRAERELPVRDIVWIGVDANEQEEVERD